MKDRSKELRTKAAKELRFTRNGGSITEKAASRKRAAAYKALAHNEEWLDGKPERSKRSEKDENDLADERARDGEFRAGKQETGELPPPREAQMSEPEERERPLIDGLPFTKKAP